MDNGELNMLKEWMKDWLNSLTEDIKDVKKEISEIKEKQAQDTATKEKQAEIFQDVKELKEKFFMHELKVDENKDKIKALENFKNKHSDKCPGKKGLKVKYLVAGGVSTGGLIGGLVYGFLKAIKKI